MKEFTPHRYRCEVGFCPAIFRLEDGRVLIIGKRPPEDVRGLLDDGTPAVVVDIDMLENMPQVLANMRPIEELNATLGKSTG